MRYLILLVLCGCALNPQQVQPAIAGGAVTKVVGDIAEVFQPIFKLNVPDLLLCKRELPSIVSCRRIPCKSGDCEVNYSYSEFLERHPLIVPAEIVLNLAGQIVAFCKVNEKMCESEMTHFDKLEVLLH